MGTHSVRLTLAGLDRGDYRALLGDLVRYARLDDIPSLAAGVAFRIFLSLFPALFAAVAVFSLVFSGEDIVRLLTGTQFVPADIREQLETPLVRFVEEAGRGATLTVAAGVLGGLWAASSAAVLLCRALTRIFGRSETRRFVKQRVTGVVIAVALFGALVALAVLLVAGGALQAGLLDTLGLTSAVRTLLGVVLTVGRVLLAVLVLVGLFAFVYWVGPDRPARPSFQWLTPGAVIGVTGWVVLSLLFGLYARVAGANPVYGALGGVIVLLLWLQLSMAVLLAGAELNALLRARLAGDHGDRVPTGE